MNYVYKQTDTQFTKVPVMPSLQSAVDAKKAQTVLDSILAKYAPASLPNFTPIHLCKVLNS